MMDVRGVARRFDRYQQKHVILAFPIALIRKFSEDQAGSRAALISYYGFFSLFPLLLLTTTIFGTILRGDPHLEHSLVHSELANFPIIGPQIEHNVHSLKGNTVAMVIGAVGTIWVGTYVGQAIENAMNAVWNTPLIQRPSMLIRRLKGLGAMAILGGASLLSTILAGVVAGAHAGDLTRVAGFMISFLADLGVFALTYKLLTAERLAWKDIAVGTLTATVAWEVLQAIGGWYVARELRKASDVYGFFAIVIGLLSWLYLTAQVMIISAEINVMTKRHLWPRSLLPPPYTTADQKAFSYLARMEERARGERIAVGFDDPTNPLDSPRYHET